MTPFTNIDDLRALAKKRVPRMFYDYADSGSWTESTYRANEADFQAVKLRQRVAVNMENRSTRSTMVGVDVAMPVALAPTGLTGMQHADGEILAARAAEAFGVPFTLSTMSICSIEDVAAHTKAPFWFQLYVMRDRAFIESLIDRAKAANCGALMLTLDLQILGQRNKDIRNGLTAPPKPTLANLINLATKPRWCLAQATAHRTPRPSTMLCPPGRRTKDIYDKYRTAATRRRLAGHPIPALHPRRCVRRVHAGPARGTQCDDARDVLRHPVRDQSCRDRSRPGRPVDHRNRRRLRPRRRSGRR